jgi:beta-aspartyl-peptidase (threonine type)
MLVRTSAVLATVLAASCGSPPRAAALQPPPVTPSTWGIALHGGAGTINRDKLTPEREAAIRAAMEHALKEGHTILARGGSSLDAVTRAIVLLEDSPYFNAGKGAVFTHDGVNELDAAIMSGTSLAAGSVAGVRTVKNPILLARAVMEKSKHVMLVAAGADEFAGVAGIERVDPSYFRTDERWQQLQDALAEDKFGTVGAVALDQAGALAAGTSTGGMTNKRYGRVGDSPIIGAGTYANDFCAVSATGHGEYFIRHTVAHEICARAEYRGIPLERAADQVVMDELVKAGGEGGLIAMDRSGNVTMPFNTTGMYRGSIGEDGVPRVQIYRD